MRTTVELPDAVLTKAKSAAALSGISLRQFFLEAIELRLLSGERKGRRTPPMIGSSKSRRVRISREQIDEAMFG